ncbi:hypothetical protein E2C01_066975 [Portunus trituberculatus]|uniref:Uncharacterized protein n=1 Tax=Portunus trituberculatus TaxID=210409 RepID=A0A5B7HRG1_PORTR|nr:hypothetical protein [Portunus trituberculatus]
MQPPFGYCYEVAVRPSHYLKMVRVCAPYREDVSEASAERRDLLDRKSVDESENNIHIIRGSA